MSDFKAGDRVLCIDANHCTRLRKGEEYCIQGLTFDGLVVLKDIPFAWGADRFELLMSNPCADIKVDAYIDWKSRYENLQKKYDELEGANILNRNAVRLQREAREKVGAELATVKASVEKVERALFLAQHYNWSRIGLTWEEAARDLFNYVLYGLGKPQRTWADVLLPVRKRPTMSPFSVGNAKASENSCLDKVEPVKKGCSYCCNGGCPDCLSRSKS